MNASGFLDTDNLLDLVDKGFIRAIVHEGFGYTMYVTTDKAEREWLPAEWPDEALAAQGLILADDWTVIARPREKVFEWADFEGVVPNHSGIKIEEKMYGTYCFMYPTPENRVAFATLDGFDNERARAATAMYHLLYDEENVQNIITSHTASFYMINPAYPAEYNYEGIRALAFLGVVNINTGKALNRTDERWWGGSSNQRTLWTGMRPGIFTTLMLDAIQALDDNFIVTLNDTVRFEMSFEELVGFLRLDDVTPRVIWEYCRAGKSIIDLVNGVPKEFQGWILGIRDALVIKFIRLTKEVDETYEELLAQEELTKDTKAFASVVSNHPYRAMLFNLRRGFGIDHMVWDMIKPKSENPYKTRNIPAVNTQLLYL